jgi:hypothetical protein
MSRILGGNSSVSIVSATAGLCRSPGSFGAFVDVHMTISEPFRRNPIGTARGVPSFATWARRVVPRASSSRLSGRFRTSVISVESTGGRLFGWVTDPEGNRVELRQAV